MLWTLVRCVCWAVTELMVYVMFFCRLPAAYRALLVECERVRAWHQLKSCQVRALGARTRGWGEGEGEEVS